MKRAMNYAELRQGADRLLQAIQTEARGRRFQLIAIGRGGLTLGHRMAVVAGLPLNVYSPKTNTFLLPGNAEDEVLFFVEDLVAKGRTYDQVSALMQSLGRIENETWFFCPLIVDAHYAYNHRQTPMPFKIFGSVEKDWIVFPYEDFADAVEGDHGLFRDGTGQYGKGKQT